MSRRLSILLALVALAACGSEGTTAKEEPVPPDTGPDLPAAPEVPEFVFDLVSDWGSDSAFEIIDDKDLPDGVTPPDTDAPDATPDDTGKPPKDTQTTDGCVPQCTFKEGENPDVGAGTPKECGEDGCGSICGYCTYEEMCVKALCKPVCVPQCAGKNCGPDGCYGTCPPGCEENFVCGEDGLCYPYCDHDAKCAGKQCGPDGCGGSCGYCGLGFLCNEETGQCDVDPCGDVQPGVGKCLDSNVLVECVDGQLKETECAGVGADYYCKWDAPTQTFGCYEGCVPQCKWDDGSPKECGYDGCYGTCGTCPQGWECKAGKCYPLPGGECGWITAAGSCIDNKLWFCANNLLYVDDCPALGKNCKFDLGSQKFKCL
jgi:hypothetical protein